MTIDVIFDFDNRHNEAKSAGDNNIICRGISIQTPVTEFKYFGIVCIVYVTCVYADRCGMGWQTFASTEKRNGRDQVQNSRMERRPEDQVVCKRRRQCETVTVRYRRSFQLRRPTTLNDELRCNHSLTTWSDRCWSDWSNLISFFSHLISL